MVWLFHSFLHLKADPAIHINLIVKYVILWLIWFLKDQDQGIFLDEIKKSWDFKLAWKNMNFTISIIVSEFRMFLHIQKTYLSNWWVDIRFGYKKFEDVIYLQRIQLHWFRIDIIGQFNE